MRTDRINKFFFAMIFLLISLCPWHPQIVAAEEAGKIILEQDEKLPMHQNLKITFPGICES